MSEEYYNNQTKERFLKERENSYAGIRKIMRPYFNLTKYYEEQFDRDCSAFTSKEILNLYASIGTRSWERLLNMNSQLKLYTSWSIREGLVPDNQNHYEELDKNDMYSCINVGAKKKMFITRKELLHKLNSIDNVSDAFLALGLFEGLCGPMYSDFFELMPEQFHDGKVFLKDRELTVSNKLTALAIESANDYTYIRSDGKQGRYREDDPRVIKDTSGANFESDSDNRNRQKIYRKIQKLDNQYGDSFSYAALKNSGRLDMLQRLMAEDKSNDARQTYDNHKEEIESRYGTLQRVYRWLEENKEYLESSSK